MKVWEVLKENCVVVANHVKAALNADLINIIGIMNEQVAYAFRKFDPIDRMIISRDNGRVNSYFMNTKDQLLTIREFARI